MLEPERNAHDGDAEKQTAEDVYQSDLPPAEYNPKDIQDQGKTAGLTLAERHLTAERPESIEAYLEKLHTERYTYNSNAAEQAGQGVEHRRKKTAQHEPGDVTKKSHDLLDLETVGRNDDHRDDIEEYTRERT